jgi:WD40 repeat protein
VFSPDGKTTAVASSDGTVSLRDAATGEPKQVCRAQGTDSAGIYSLHHFISVAFSPDSKRILIGSRDATVQVWDVASGRLEQTYKGHTGSIAGVAFLPDEQILSLSTDDTIKVWPANGGVEASVLRRHSMQVNAVAFSPDGHWLASGSLAGISERANVKLWNARTGKFFRQFDGDNGMIQALAFSPDSRRLASASMGKTVNVRDIATGQLIKRLADFRQFVDDVAFLSDGKRLLTRCSAEVRIWDLDTGFSQGRPLQVGGGNSAVSADGNWLASIEPYAPGTSAVPRQTMSMSVRDLRRDDEVRKLTYDASEGHWTIALGLSGDGGLLAEGRSNGTVAVWNVGTGKVQITWKNRTLHMTRLGFSSDARRLATLSVEGKLKLWDVASGQEVYTLGDTTGGVQGLEAKAAQYGTENRLGPVAFSPTGDRLAAACVNSVLLWNIAPVTAGTAESLNSGEPDLVPCILVERRSPTADGCTKNLLQISRAMQSFLMAHAAFPMPATADDHGQPLLSWRVELLPDLGERALYDKFKLGEPWDSPHNKALLKEMPALFSCPGRTKAESFTTNYRVFSGSGALFEQNQKVGIRNISDGTVNTIMVVEADGAVPWTKPDELVFNPRVVDSFQGAGSPHPEGFYASFADGSVRLINKTIDPKLFHDLITRAGGEEVGGFAY